MRRNPVRETKKKIDSFTRSRLLATKRRHHNDDNFNHGTDKKQIKSSNVPYMNTRLATKKMYNVGATYQAPTVKDEIEWREWPIHGMHERPIYHSRVGLGVEYLGQNFVSLDGYSYEKVSQSLNTDAPIIGRCRKITHSKGEKKNQCCNIRNFKYSFEICMHESLHSILAYSVQIKLPQYTRLFDYCKNINEEIVPEQEVKFSCLQESNKVNCGVASSKIPITKPPLNLKCIKNHAKLQKVLERGSKNTLILLKTTDPSLKKENCTGNAVEMSSNTLIPVRVESDIDSSHIILKQTSANQSHMNNSNQKTNDLDKNYILTRNDKASVSQSNIQTNDGDTSKEYWLQELISDTAILYCTAIGIHQDDFVMYLNTLDANQCINWINSRYS